MFNLDTLRTTVKLPFILFHLLYLFGYSLAGHMQPPSNDIGAALVRRAPQALQEVRKFRL
jgi:hypothetical protein